MKGKPEPMITYILQRKDGEWDCHYKKIFRCWLTSKSGLTVKSVDFSWKRSKSNLPKVVILGSLLIKIILIRLENLKMIKIILFIKEPFQDVSFGC